MLKVFARNEISPKGQYLAELFALLLNSFQVIDFILSSLFFFLTYLSLTYSLLYDISCTKQNKMVVVVVKLIFLDLLWSSCMVGDKTPVQF